MSVWVVPPIRYAGKMKALCQDGNLDTTLLNGGGDVIRGLRGCGRSFRQAGVCP